MENILISAIGMQDPLSGKKMKEGKSQPGPLISFLDGARDGEGLDFSAHHTLINSGVKDRFEQYRDMMRDKRPGLSIKPHIAHSDDPTDYGYYFEFMRTMLGEIRDYYNGSEVRFHVLVSPGSATMQALWVLMVKGGYIDAELWMGRSRDDAAKHGQPLVENIGPQIDPLPIIIRLERELERTKAEIEAETTKREHKKTGLSIAVYGFNLQWPEMRDNLFNIWRHILRREPVFILGDSGSGKTYLVQKLSEHEPEIKTFVRYANRNPELVDSDIFGHVKGAFTGSTGARAGYLEKADGGTFFVDEFADLPAETQVRLLDVVEGRSSKKVGDDKEQYATVSIAAATYKAASRSELIKECDIRPDLLNRFKHFYKLPSLREYPYQDLELIVQKAFERELSNHTDDEFRVCKEVASDALERLVTAIRHGLLPGNFWHLDKVTKAAINAADDSDSGICKPSHVEKAVADLSEGDGMYEKPRRFLQNKAEEILSWWDGLRRESPELYEKLKNADGGLPDGVLGHFLYKTAYESQFAGSYSELQNFLGGASFTSGGSRRKRIMENDPFSA